MLNGEAQPHSIASFIYSPAIHPAGAPPPSPTACNEQVALPIAFKTIAAFSCSVHLNAIVAIRHNNGMQTQ
jgi:hypothetical protein